MSENILRGAIQKVATGPEFSKNISEEDSYHSMLDILGSDVDSVQAAIYLIALRMKRETMDENIGSLKALIDKSNIITSSVDEVIDIAEPYNGFSSKHTNECISSCSFFIGRITLRTHGVETVGPKFGLTIKKILKTAGINVDQDVESAASALSTQDLGWAYIDQEKFCQPLYKLVELRTRMVKRTILTTIEVWLAQYVANQRHTYLPVTFMQLTLPFTQILLKFRDLIQQYW